MSGFVYVMESQRNGSYYVGSCDNVVARYPRHASGQVKATKRLRPWVVLGWREYPTRTMARQVEWALKQKKSRRYLERWLRGEWEPVVSG